MLSRLKSALDTVSEGRIQLATDYSFGPPDPLVTVTPVGSEGEPQPSALQASISKRTPLVTGDTASDTPVTPEAIVMSALGDWGCVQDVGLQNDSSTV